MVSNVNGVEINGPSGSVATDVAPSTPLNAAKLLAAPAVFTKGKPGTANSDILSACFSASVRGLNWVRAS